MTFETIKTITITIIFIGIIHLFIRYLLHNENITNTINNHDENNETIIDENKIMIENNIENDNETIEHHTDFDLNKMKHDLLKYINNDKKIYQSKENELPESNSNLLDNSKANFNNSNTDLENYYKTVVNTNDITLYEEPKEKQVYIDNTPEIKTNTLKPNNTNFDNNITWSYKDENIMNGGEIDGGIFGYETMDSSYATLN